MYPSYSQDSYGLIYYGSTQNTAIKQLYIFKQIFSTGCRQILPYF
uniref:Uncharacterized protein n=1 Tax=Anguilla anguilla TaxID=7936 RepID=A0A0E9PI84_ANGAN